MRCHHNKVTALGLGVVYDGSVRMFVLDLDGFARDTRRVCGPGDRVEYFRGVLQNLLVVLARRVLNHLRVER